MGDAGVPGSELGARRRRLGGIVLSLVILLTVAVLAIRGGDGGEAEAIDGAPRLADVEEVAALADSLGHALYWVGPRGEDELELTQEADGSVYLRYLPPGVEAGDPRTDFLTVGTYPVAGAQAALRRTAAEADSPLGRAAGGGLILANPEAPTSAYLAYPGSDLQLEVYDPEPGRALGLIRAGALRPVG